MKSGVLAVGPNYSWQVYEMRVGNEVVEGAACYLERREDGLRGLLRHDSRGWWVAGVLGDRMNVPGSVVSEIAGTQPYGFHLPQEQLSLAVPMHLRRKVRGFPATVSCPDCGAEVIAS